MSLDVRYVVEILLSLPKTIFFNFRCLSFGRAMKLPFFVYYKTRLHGVRKGSVTISTAVPLHTFMVKLGNKGSVGIVENRYNSICINRGILLFEGAAAIGLGFSLRVDGGGRLTIGRNFNANRNLFLSCTKKVDVGSDVLFGWNVSVRDSDGHTLRYDDTDQPTLAPVRIGSHVWVCAESHILKGSCIGDNSVVAYGSLLTRGSEETGTLWGGWPAKALRSGVTWDSKAWDV